ncbi:MAG: hypothetical protein JRF46_17385 [Deltaproteobacteria bacterium]|nr:hypothetical protein [Deltaproteobacteria bacterium]
MATGKEIQLTGKIGEHLVTAELARRGIFASPFSGNVPDIDIVGYCNGKLMSFQVKAIRKTSWQFDVRKFLIIEVQHDRQVVKGINTTLDRNIICIFVKIGEELGEDEFYIFRMGWLQDYFKETYKGRISPQNINSYHCAIWLKDIQEHKDRWDIVIKNKF